MRPPLPVLALALLLVAPVLAGCVSAPSAPAAEERREAYWARAAPSHVADLDLAAPEWVVTGDVTLAQPPTELRLVPPRSPLDLGRAPPVEVPWNAPSVLLVENATVNGELGTLVVEFGQGVTLRGGAFDVALEQATLTPRGLTTSVAVADERFPMVCMDHPFGGGGSCDSSAGSPPPLPEPWRSQLPPVAELAVDLPPQFAVAARNLTLHKEDGNTTSLGGLALVEGATALLAGGGGRSVEASLALQPLAWTGRVHLEAADAQGRITLQREAHAVEDDSTGLGHVALSLRGEGALEWRAEGTNARLSVAGVETTRVMTGGLERIEAELVALPNLIEARAAPGEPVRFDVLLAETSGGADAQLRGFRVENASVEVRFVVLEDFAATRELLAAIERLGDETDQNPWIAPVTVPAMAAMGLAAPLLAFGDALFAIFSSLFPPQLVGAVEADDVMKAGFALQMPAQAEELTLYVQGANFEEVPVRVQLRPVPAAS